MEYFENTRRDSVTPSGNSQISPKMMRFGNRFAEERAELVMHLRQKGISDERLLHAISVVERHRFVSPLFVNRSYEDSALPISNSQTISQPFTVAIMTECLQVKQGEKILEVGTGSGYQAAILFEMGAKVFTIERHMDLFVETQKRFASLGYDIASKCGDGTLGWKEFSPFDKVIVTAGAPDVPDSLLQQLKDGGMMVIPIGSLEVQNLHVIRRVNDTFEAKTVGDFKFVPLIGRKGWK